MIETLTAVFVVLSVLALGLICLLVYLVVGWTASTENCPNCGGSGRTVVHDRAGLMQVRCPRCHR
jgi:hypothetical protein